MRKFCSLFFFCKSSHTFVFHHHTTNVTRTVFHRYQRRNRERVCTVLMLILIDFV